MNKLTKSLSLLLCFVLLALVFASCGKSEETVGTTAAPETADVGSTEAEPGVTTAETTVEATTAGKWELESPKIKLITEKDRTLKFELSNHTTAEKSSKNDIYIKGPDAVEEGVTPPIQQMVYERNARANELLGTTVSYIFWDGGYDTVGDQIDLVVKGNAPDAPDMFVNMEFAMSRELLNSTFKDVLSIPGSYFDFTSDGWLYEWMMNLSLTGDRAYILGGDYYLDVFRAISLLPLNMTLMDENAAKLADAFIEEDEPLGDGEKLTPRFFDFVEEGKWTWDVLGDEFGEGGQCACSFIYSCGEELTERYKIEDPSDPNNGKWWIKFADTSDGLNKIFDAVKSVIQGPGTLSTNYTHAGNTPEQPGIAYHQTKFAAGETLFAGAQMLGALEEDVFQQMEDLYSVVPFPKVDAAKEYNTIVCSTGDVGAINVNVNARKARVLTAYIQYCTENSPAIREQFQQIVTKYTTTVYDQGTDRMLDLIYKSIRWARDKTIDDLAGISANRWHGYMRKQHFEAGSDYIATQYAAVRGTKQNLLDRDLKKWYNLPKVEPAN